jgi:SAM-dependent methyltransferase
MNDEHTIRYNNEMRLGKFEFFAMNNPLRRLLQKYGEFKLFKEMLAEHSINLGNKIIVDGGCGSGFSTQLLTEEYNPQKIIAFDYMPEQIALAKKRNINVDFFVGDLTNINLNSDFCDAVFIFGVIHHIPGWKKALSEIHRILKPGGCLLIEEPRYRFSWQELESGLEENRLEIRSIKHFFFRYFHSYLCIKR